MLSDDCKVPKKEAIFTICDANYAVMALTMFESVSKHYPESDLFLFIIGKGNIEKIDDSVNVIYIEDMLDEVDLSQRLAYYLSVELATSFRPHCFEYIFSNNYNRAIYLDPDIYVFRRMTEVDELLDLGANGVVTPHAIRAARSNVAIEGDETFLKCGIFNMGFMALNFTSESIKMISWWKGKLKWQCVADSRRGLFVDQKWMDLLPTYFDGFEILKSPLYNLAPWNSEHYAVITDLQGNFYLDTFENPIAFIHFSGVKRSSNHFTYLIEARDFYLKELKKREFMKLGFTNHEVIFKPTKLHLDKICIFLYKDYVKYTGDITSNPLNDMGFYNYLLSLDKETNLPVYIRKLFDVFPDILVGYVNFKGKLDYDSVIKWMKNGFNYDGVVNLGTLIQLRNASSKSGFTDTSFYNSESNAAHSEINYNALSSYHSAVSTLLEKNKNTLNDSTKSGKEIGYHSDRIEIKLRHVKVCIPYFSNGNCLMNESDFIKNNYTEIWVPNVFLQNELKSKLGVENIAVISHPVQKPEYNLVDINIPKNKFIILIKHDFSMDFREQGTLVSLKAFKKAFEKDANVLLICCALNSEESEDYNKLVNAFGKSEKAKLINTDAQSYYSYLHYAHCFLSLHEKDLFGFHLAEALVLGKQVIATGANGNYDYLNVDNGFLIENSSNGVNIDDVALIIKSIYSDENILNSKSKNAIRFIQKHFSPNTIGFMMEVRLDELIKNSNSTLPKIVFGFNKSNDNTNKRGSFESSLRNAVKKIPYATSLYRHIKGLDHVNSNFSNVDDSSNVVSVKNESFEERDQKELYEAVMKILLKNIYRPDYLE